MRPPRPHGGQGGAFGPRPVPPALPAPDREGSATSNYTVVVLLPDDIVNDCSSLWEAVVLVRLAAPTTFSAAEDALATLAREMSYEVEDFEILALFAGSPVNLLGEIL